MGKGRGGFLFVESVWLGERKNGYVIIGKKRRFNIASEGTKAHYAPYRRDEDLDRIYLPCELRGVLLERWYITIAFNRKATLCVWF